MEHQRRTWAQIDLNHIAHNFQTIRTLSSSKIMAVVKANAYGHGAITVSQQLEQIGADWFAVSNFEEAECLRIHGIQQPILVLGYTPPDRAAQLAHLHISQTVYASDYAAALSDAAVEAGVCLDCHIKLDTGMGRIGFLVREDAMQTGVLQAAAVCAMEGLNCTGVFTHFSCADEKNSDSIAFTRSQFLTFLNAIAILEEKGFHFALRHCCNSAATLCFPEMHLDMVRPGIVLYGLSPSLDCREQSAALRPAMRLYSTISHVKEIKEGTPVSYGRTYTTQEPDSRLATIAVGYADGYRRNLSNQGHVLIRGRTAPIRGRVCMDQIMVDVSSIPDACMGDMVTLAGTDGAQSVTFDDLATLNGTINYEEICLVGRRVPRVYMKDGVEFGDSSSSEG